MNLCLSSCSPTSSGLLWCWDDTVEWAGTPHTLCPPRSLQGRHSWVVCPDERLRAGEAHCWVLQTPMRGPEALAPFLSILGGLLPPQIGAHSCLEGTGPAGRVLFVCTHPGKAGPPAPPASGHAPGASLERLFLQENNQKKHRVFHVQTYQERGRTAFPPRPSAPRNLPKFFTSRDGSQTSNSFFQSFFWCIWENAGTWN